MLATPGFPSGSWSAPPSTANSMAINGSAESCTSHASMPPGLTTRSMVIACAAEAASHNPMPATSAVSAHAPCCGEKQMRSRAFLLGSGVLDQIAGDRALLVEPAARGLLHLVGGDEADAVG